MRSDISRQTFDPRIHYKSVRMQQGRVQIDADWNEQSDITTHRIETEGLDLIGGCGSPMHNAAFGIFLAVASLSQEEQDRLTKLGVLPLKVDDFLLTAGRYYVDGILCENDSVTSFNSQPDYPTLAGDSHLPSGGPPYLTYLDVWQRYITALDDSQIREIALGGPDTGTRLKTVWQVKLFPAAGDNCVTAFNKLLNANPPSSGTLSTKTESEAPSPTPWIVPPGAGFRGLENQLYRVEIHDGGDAFNVAGGAAGTAVSELIGSNQVKVTGTWEVGQAVEIFSADAPTNLKTRTLAYITSIDQNTGTLTFNTKITNLTMTDHPRLRIVEATFKWSRDNGSVVTTIERIEGTHITVSHTGLDDIMGFAPGHWVEITDDGLELNRRPGQLAQIAEVDSARRLITLKTDPRLLDAVSSDGVNPTLHPKLRRWDGIGAVNTNSTSADSGYIDIEDGVQVRFGTGHYRTGDYWMVPARTATADAQSGKIEWPQDDNKAPVALPPLGIHHHYCPLGLLSFDNNTGFALLDDCRHFFPPVTELTSLFYVSGEGQEVMPDLTQPTLLVPLPQSLVVGVANGSWPVQGAKLRFHVEKGTGSVMPKGGAPQGDGKTIDVLTDVDGLAACDWHVDSITQSQQVQATLLDADDKPGHLRIIFTANLSVADKVAYDPGTCATLEDQKTVQQALDRLSHLVSLYYLSGDGQKIMPNEVLQPLRIQAASRCGPVTDQPVTVRFEIKSGSGTVNGASTPVDIPTDAGGVAACNGEIDNTTPFQEVEATLIADAAHPIVPPTLVRFSATLSTAAHVSYDPTACPDLKAAGVGTVQAAIDQLCQIRERDPGIHITDLRLSSQPLVNDTDVTEQDLANGIRVLCDRTVDPGTVKGKPTCFVTLEMPFPFNDLDRRLWGEAIIGFQPLILAADVNVENAENGGSVIIWQPVPATRSWLTQRLFNAPGMINRLLAHLTLKGDYIWSEDTPPFYLDGEVFGIRQRDRTNIDLDLRQGSGDDLRGGDFEMWFWLVPTLLPRPIDRLSAEAEAPDARPPSEEPAPAEPRRERPAPTRRRRKS